MSDIKLKKSYRFFVEKQREGEEKERIAKFFATRLVRNNRITQNDLDTDSIIMQRCSNEFIRFFFAYIAIADYKISDPIPEERTGLQL